MKRKCTIGLLIAYFLLLGVISIPRTYNVEPVKIASKTAQDGRTATNTVSREKPPHSAVLAQRPHIRNVVADLKHQESTGRADIVVLDRNGKFSFSCLQFQRATFLRYATRYGYPTSTQAMMDCGVQTELAVKMLSEDFQNIRHWRTSATKLGLL